LHDYDDNNKENINIQYDYDMGAIQSE